MLVIFHNIKREGIFSIRGSLLRYCSREGNANAGLAGLMFGIIQFLFYYSYKLNLFVKQCRNSISGLWYIMYHKNKCILLLQRASEGMLRLLLFLYANIWQHFMQYMDPTIYDFILNKNKNKNFGSKMCIAY